MEQLLHYVREYEEYYIQPIQNEFHCYCSLITSQRVRFQTGRAIRRKLYEICGYPLTIESVSQADLSTIPLTALQKSCITQLYDGISPKEISGIGPWTMKGVKILMQTDSDVNLYEDAYIRKRLSEYIGLTSPKECREFIASAKGNETAVSYFLWRITPNGIRRVKSGEELTRDNFL